MELNNDKLWSFYQENREAYQYIENRLDATRSAIREADPVLREHVLFMADSYALITAMTKVEPADVAWSGVASNPTNADHVADVLSTSRAHTSDDMVQFYNSKADYIRRNMDEVDYTKQAELFMNEQWHELHKYKMENVLGLAAVKGAFSMSMSGVTEYGCLDTNMLQMFGLDEDDVGSSTSSEYMEYVEAARSQTPRLAEELDPYPWQWVCFDYFRESPVTVHDSWFVSVGDALNNDAITV